MRDLITLDCEHVQAERNYTTTKNKKTTTEKLDAQEVLPALPQAHACTRKARSERL